MARTTKQLSGGGKDKFLRGVVGRASGPNDGDGAQIADMLCNVVTEVRVRREVWEDISRAMPPAATSARPAETPPPSQETHATPAPAFDPFAFSAVAVMARKGAAGLLAELGRISDPSNLRQLAEAQHLVIAETSGDPEALRQAIVRATEQRIAERRAAAS
jgi:hypothetical protein